MLKLKRIDLLTKNDKIHNKSENGCCDSVQKYKLMLLPMESLTDTSCRYTIGNSDGERATSLYGDPGLNPLVIPSVQSSEKIPRHQNVFFSWLFRWQFLVFTDFLTVNS